MSRGPGGLAGVVLREASDGIGGDSDVAAADAIAQHVGEVIHFLLKTKRLPSSGRRFNWVQGLDLNQRSRGRGIMSRSRGGG